MKKKILLIVCLAILAAFSFGAVACEKEPAPEVEINEYVVNFDTDYGSSVAAQVVEEGKTVSEPETPDRAGYTFGGWYKDEACSDGQEFNFSSQTITADTTIYAKWIKNLEGGEKNGFEFTVIEGTQTYSVSASDGYDFGTLVTIPSQYNGLSVTRIDDYGMSNLSAEEVIIPSSIEEIGDYAFYQNSNIYFVDMSQTTAQIGEGAFKNSTVMAVDLGGVTKIGKEAFSETNLTFVTVPETVTEIGDGALNSKSILEVIFLGQFPTLGQSVFGDGSKTIEGSGSDMLGVYATESSWNALVEGVAGETFNDQVTEATGLKEAYVLYLDEDAAASSGLYTGEVKVLMSAGEYAVVLTDEEIIVAELYGHDHVYLDVGDIATRRTIVLDASSRTCKFVAPDETGTVIDGTILYDYVGGDAVYYVPEEVTSVASGAGVFNTNVRYIVFGDGVAEIGDYVFFNAYLFGLSFGTGITSIGDFAFGNNSYISEIVFRGETAPTYVGAGAFCYLSGTGILPVAFVNEVNDAAKIYTPLDYEDGWWTNSEVGDFLTVLNASLEALGEQVPIDQSTDERIRYVDQTGGMFGKLTSYGFDAVGQEYETEFGKLIMLGTDSGYLLADLAGGNYDGNGYYKGGAYAYWNYTTSDETEGSPVRIEILYDYVTMGRVRSFFVYGKFLNGAFVARGDEYGTFGELGDTILSIDGYGAIVYTMADGTTYEGTYTVAGNTLTVTGIPGIEKIIYTPGADGSAASIAYEVLTSLGAEAGVFYDYANRAILQLDGKPFSENSVNYSGRLTLTYNGAVVADSVPYTRDGSYIKFTLNGTQKSWDYSRVASDYVVKGYYDNNYNIQMKFIVETFTELRGEYTGELGTIELDGYFTAEIGSKVYTYTVFGETTNIVLFDGAEVSEIVYLNTAAKTYTVATAAEAGMYYCGTSANYKVYFDGDGNLIYDSGSYAYGTYEYNAATGELKSWINSDADAKDIGMLNLEKGYGYIVYEYYGDSYITISRKPFADTVYPSIMVYLQTDGVWSGNSVSLSIYQSGNVLFVQVYGYPFAVTEVSDFADGATFTIPVTSSYFTALDITFTIHIDGNGVVSYTGAPEYAGGAPESIVSGSTEYVFCWLNAEKTIVGIYENSGYVSNLFCGEITWTNGGKDFQIEKLDMDSGDYFSIVVTGYGTDAQSVEAVSSSSSFYDSSDGAEYKYYKINIYSADQLWVSNDNIDGASPEVAYYTVEEIEGVTYYTFTSTASNMVVTFHWNGSYFAVDSEVPVDSAK